MVQKREKVHPCSGAKIFLTAGGNTCHAKNPKCQLVMKNQDDEKSWHLSAKLEKSFSKCPLPQEASQLSF